VLKAFNGRIIGAKELYTTPSGVNKRIEAVMGNGRFEEVEDLIQ